MKKILVPIDFSESSEIAVKIAKELADLTGAEIDFIHVLETVPSEKEKYAEDPNQKLQSFILNKGIEDFKSFVTEGIPFDDVIMHCEEHQTDLIVLASEGTSKYHGTYTASNVLRITRLAPCPVLIIPSVVKEFSAEKILFVNDFTYEYDYKEDVEKVFQSLIQLTSELSSEIDLLYIKLNGQPEEKIKKCMSEFSNGFSQDYKTIIATGKTVEEGALDYAKAKNYNIISIIGHGSGNYYTQLRTSICEKLIEISNLPVLVFRISK
jgi:nucleotide-binding universal stress UspA family protein